MRRVDIDKLDRQAVELLIEEEYKIRLNLPHRYPYTKEEYDGNMQAMRELPQHALEYFLLTAINSGLLPDDYIDAVMEHGYRGTLIEFKRR